jgi:FkbM family methyltransferase
MKNILFQLLAGSVGRVIGRRNLVRYGNYLARAGRLDIPNDLAGNNGEALVQSVVLGHTKQNPTVIVDCGANVGDWARQLSQNFEKKGHNALSVYCFEPSSFTYQKLLSTVNNIKVEGVDIVPVNKALSSVNGESSLSIAHQGAGTNSLIPIPNSSSDEKESVSLMTLDAFSEELDIQEITFLKIDAEGHDPDILKGAVSLLDHGCIGVVQFEYNWRWIYGNHLLYKVFMELTEYGYHVGKVTPKGIQFYTQYDVELETFVEANYIACTSEWRNKFPVVPWWKE